MTLLEEIRQESQQCNYAPPIYEEPDCWFGFFFGNSGNGWNGFFTKREVDEIKNKKWEKMFVIDQFLGEIAQNLLKYWDT